MNAEAAGRNRSGASRLETSGDDTDEHVRWATHAWSEIDPDVEGIVCRVERAHRHLERAAVDTATRSASPRANSRSFFD